MNHRSVIVEEYDIRDIDPLAWMKRLGITPGQLDLLAGCPPCQGFSAMRTLNGSRSVDDERNDLIFEFLRIAQALQPRVIMLENVPALAADPRIGTVRQRLLEDGYRSDVTIVNALDYGVPQRRRRTLLLASREGAVKLATADSRRMTVREAIGDLAPAGTNGDQLHTFSNKRSAAVMRRIRQIPRDGGSRSDLGDDAQLNCHRNCTGFNDVYGRMAWEKPAPTITGGCLNPSKGRFLHPEEDRAITLREAALLQGFPQNYQLSLERGRYHAAMLIGNALPPELIRRQAVTIAQHLRERGAR
jgi:DNA (cytosine-5)-methyltransferase 1